ncbi:hypothetical protein BJV78DRAFT_1198274 [Lactifluus subvellereus]|nr:hypothetical protein BJV78DRAFT_1198274 [Lactifluus subvellereus]
MDDSYGHPPRQDGSQPYVTGGAPHRPSSGYQAPSWRPDPLPPELSLIHNARPALFPLNPNRYRSSSVAPPTPSGTRANSHTHAASTPRGRPLQPGPAWLTRRWLGGTIPDRGPGGHDPEEGARACIDLLNLKRRLKTVRDMVSLGRITSRSMLGSPAPIRAVTVRMAKVPARRSDRRPR